MLIDEQRSHDSKIQSFNSFFFDPKSRDILTKFENYFMKNLERPILRRRSNITKVNKIPKTVPYGLP
jgi:hypothetical protein